MRAFRKLGHEATEIIASDWHGIERRVAMSSSTFGALHGDPWPGVNGTCFGS